MENQSLSLNEMLQIAEKVPEWEGNEANQFDTKFKGVIGSVNIRLSRDSSKRENRDIYYIQAYTNENDSILGREEGGEELVQLYTKVNSHYHNFSNQLGWKESIQSARNLIDNLYNGGK
ncbi:hypothetical protein CEE44_01245 [Candidatus Woesearchaeota archaeon B3_Woes]|nr:MAG: hypothetical protein CEE44_01245 [Candidatus Woesearchaeota archaeon B3_Woes]